MHSSTCSQAAVRSGPTRRPIREGQLAVMGEGGPVTVFGDATQDSRSPLLEVLLLGGSPIREEDH